MSQSSLPRESLFGPISLGAALIIVGSGIQISRELGCIGLGLWIISVLAPLPVNLWVSLHWPGRHQGAHFGIGILLGTVGFVASWIFLELFYPPGAYDTGDWILLVLVYPIWCTAMAVAGGLYGDSVRIGMSPSEITNLVRRFAAGIDICGAIFSFACQAMG